MTLYKYLLFHCCGAGSRMRTCHAAHPGSISCWNKFAGWGFRGFSSPIRQLSGNLKPTTSPIIILAIIFILPYSPFSNEWMCEWYVSSFMFVLSRTWLQHWTDPSSEEALHVLLCSESMYVTKVNFLSRQVVALWGPSGVSHVKARIKMRLNSSNEWMNEYICCLWVIDHFCFLGLNWN